MQRHGSNHLAGDELARKGTSAKRDITSPDDLALDGSDGFSELIDPCADLACKLFPAFIPGAIGLFPTSGVLLFLGGERGWPAQEKRAENGGRGEGRGCEQGVEIGAKSEAVLLSGETPTTGGGDMEVAGDGGVLNEGV